MSTAVFPPDSDRDFGVPWHYGDPLREQRLITDGSAAVDLSHFRVIAITGPDRLTWLHSLTTQHMEALHGSTLALILSPHGHVEHELHCVDDGETTWVIVQPQKADELMGYLESMKFMTRVDVRDVSSQYAVVWEPVGEPDELLPSWLIPGEFHGELTPAGTDRGGDATRYQVPRLGDVIGREVIVERSQLPERLGQMPHRAGTWAWNAMRIAAAMPRFGFETDHRTLPHEVGWVGPGVHLAKGCYRGQEAVARVHNLGKPPRRMAVLMLDGSDDILPSHADPVFLDDREVGWVGSVAQHYEYGPIATAILKRNVPLDATLRVQAAGGSVSATQHN
jgi:tRNA-modifying protein YgfZ